MVDSGVLFAILDREGVLHSWNKAFETFFDLVKKRTVPIPSFTRRVTEESEITLDLLLRRNALSPFSFNPMATPTR
jgi:hypothetical protein